MKIESISSVGIFGKCVVAMVTSLCMGCSAPPDPRFERVLAITGHEFDGYCNVGDARGWAIISIKGTRATVEYGVPDVSNETVTEVGELKDFRITNDGADGTICFRADWDNEDAGDGKFRLVLIDEVPNTIFCEIGGDSWVYFEKHKLTDDEFRQVVEIMAVERGAP